MKPKTILGIVLGIGCSTLLFGLVYNSLTTSNQEPVPITYMDTQLQYMKDMIKKAEYYKVDPNLIAEANKLDYTKKLVSKASIELFNQLEDKISEVEDKIRLEIYKKKSTPEQYKQAKALFDKAWQLNSEMHKAIKEKDNQKVLEIREKFGELETPLTVEILNIPIPEVQLN